MHSRDDRPVVTISSTISITYADGHEGTIADVWFKTSGQDTKVLLDDGFEVSTLAARLPQLAGKGTVPDLRYVMN